MHNAYIVTGTPTNERTVTLDEALPLTATKVRLVVEPLVSASPRSYQEIVVAIREQQRARGHRPPTKETDRKGDDQTLSVEDPALSEP